MADNRQATEIGTEMLMRDSVYRRFIRGLRVAIKRSGYRYEKDFADGIMNAVTLSRNLNLKARMDEENIEACAKKLGLDVAEIVLLDPGPDAADVRSSWKGGDSGSGVGEEAVFDGATTKRGDQYSYGAQIYPIWTAEELREMSKDELLTEVSNYSRAITAAYSNSASMISGRASVLAAERNRLLDQIEELRDESQFFQQFWRTSSSALTVIDAERLVVVQNRASVALLGDISGQPFCPDTRNEASACRCPDCAVASSIAEMKPFRGYHEIYGGYKLMTVNPVNTKQGVMAMVMLADADNLRRSTERGDLLQQQIEYLLESTTNPIIMGNGARQIVYVNNAFLTLFGADRAELTTVDAVLAIIARRVKNASEVLEVSSNARTGRTPGYCEIEMLDGTRHWMSVEPAPGGGAISKILPTEEALLHERSWVRRLFPGEGWE